jgi:hypothetical protein
MIGYGSVRCPTCGHPVDINIEKIDINIEKTAKRDRRVLVPDHQLTSAAKAYREYDGRLIAMGWNHFTPQEWEAVFPAFYRYWEKAAQRPEKVGSPYNPLPEVAFQYWRRKIPAWICQALELEESPIRIQQSRRSWKKSRLRNAARAMRRTSACMSRGELGYSLVFTMKAAEALGRLCPELQRLTIKELSRIWSENGDRTNVVARKNIPWEFVADQQKKLQADKSGRLRTAIAAEIRSEDGERVSARALELAGWEKVSAVLKIRESSSKGYLSRFLAPDFPGVSVSQSLQIAQGVSPMELSKGTLSRHEAHDWLLHNPQWSPTQYLCSKLKNWVPEIRSVSVVRWLLAVEKRGGWQQLIKMRPVHGPAGQVGEFRFLDRVDEIQDEDLVRGPQTGVEEAFQHIAERMGAEWATKHRDDLKIISSCPRSWPRPYRAMRLLNTPSALVREGEEMGHCVGGYIDAVRRGQCYIFSVIVKGKRSTAEIGSKGTVLQHHGKGNGTPPRSNERVVNAWARRIRG